LTECRQYLADLHTQPKWKRRWHSRDTVH